jgi:uncharacterized protein with HEPN domain
MSELKLTEEFGYLLDSINLILERVQEIKQPENFVNSPHGVMILDSISMRLQNIGETVKNINKNFPGFLDKYPEIDWNKIIKFRDFISHHYESMDHEIVHNICTNNIPDLKKATEKILKEIKT